MESDSDETPHRGANLWTERERARERGVETRLHRFRFSRGSVRITLLASRGAFNTWVHYAHLCSTDAGSLDFPSFLLLYNKLPFISFLFPLAKHGNISLCLLSKDYLPHHLSHSRLSRTSHVPKDFQLNCNYRFSRRESATKPSDGFLCSYAPAVVSVLSACVKMSVSTERSDPQMEGATCAVLRLHR